MSACNAMDCSGNHLESCGTLDAMLAYKLDCTMIEGVAPDVLASLTPNKTYIGVPCIFRPAVRTVVSKLESTFLLQGNVLVPLPPSSVMLHVHDGTSGSSHAMSAVVDAIAKKVHSQLCEASVSVPQEDFEYFVEAALSGGNLRAPTVGNQTVVVV